jgi:hypothetical protein
MLFQNRKSILYTCSALLLLLPTLFVSCSGSSSGDPKASSAYITRVYDYVYGPGQHALLAKPADTTNIIGAPSDNKGWMYLGGFGGYVVAGFDHDVQNGESYDFEVYALQGASPEPGIVYVMADTNGNGLPDDTWYELKGNQFANSQRNYWVRYYKAVADSSNITWKDSKGNSGELTSGYGSKYSSKWWWPSTPGDSITFTGTRLPNAYVNTSTTDTQYWTVPAGRFTWGYAKNSYGTDYDTTVGANKFDISNAVDAAGNAVTLKSIRFIKVQTAVFQQAGWLNEISTEIRGARDLRK